jgi:hypothetical protein
MPFFRKPSRDARRRSITGCLADVFPGDLNDCIGRRASRDGFLKKGILEFRRIDLAERKIQSGWVKGCAHRQQALLNVVHLLKKA